MGKHKNRTKNRQVVEGEGATIVLLYQDRYGLRREEAPCST
jgi:hypothetical protein